MENIIEVDQLVYSYGKHEALRGLSFTALQGEVLGLLGPNGAGKTTTVRHVNGLLRPASGTIRILGLDPVMHGAEVRRATGVLTETPALYERLTAFQNLSFFGTLAGMTPLEIDRRSAELLEFFGLQERAGDRVGGYSKGMKQRLALARTLLHQPGLLFLDEPTSGLDPEVARQVHELIAGISARNGQTVILCTHNLYEAEHLCDRLAVLSRGRLLALGSLTDLRARFSPGSWVEFRFLQPPLHDPLSFVSPQRGVLAVQPQDPLCWKVQVAGKDVVPPLVAALAVSGAQILGVQPYEEPLETIYFNLQQQAGEEA